MGAVWLAAIAIGAGVTVAAQERSVLPPPASRKVDFAADIQPIFNRSCLPCHGAGVQSGGLRLDRKEAALKGGYSGLVIKPGDSAGSLLIQLVAGLKKDKVMPMQGDRLIPQQIGLLRAWIDQGAEWQDSAAAQTIVERNQPLPKSKHWAFQPVRRPVVPAVRNVSWVRNPIDNFVLARLEKEGIKPSPEADRTTLIRRVTLDLTGLPPTPQEISRFVNDNRSEVYERLVDRLLASEHYGERWARHWLDLARYADSDGYETDQLRPYAWRYRHWLVEALNRDMPFDQFTVEQIAGDLLPGATVEQRVATGFHRNTLSNREGGADLEEFRVEQVVDRASTVGTTWLGLTVGCARCHDHKYDPISQKEFYQLYAFFDSADEVNINAPIPGEMGPYLRARAEYKRKRQEILAPLEAELAQLQTTWEKRLLEAEVHPGQDHHWDRAYEVLGLVWGGNWGEGQLEGIRIVKIPVEQRTPSQKERLLDYFIRRGSIVNEQRFKELNLKDVVKKLDELAKAHPGITRAPTIEESSSPRVTRIHMRGNFRDPGIEVQPTTPSVLPPLPMGSAPPRLRLAQWLVSRDNPLTARVTVNRSWQELFGRGFVFTSEDFGAQSAGPTHPELLDWLAADFMDRGWSMKSLHKSIVMSATYRQSSNARPELQSTDPNNNLLARQSRLRLPAEVIRDAALAVSGLLNPRVGGPSVRPPQPESVSQQGFDNKWVVSEGPDRYRRGLYIFLQRTSPFAQLVTFDLADPGRTCSRRERSNSPLQALTLLNDDVFFEAAQALAVRIFNEQPGSVSDRIAYGFGLAVGRKPDATEKDRLAGYLGQQMEILRRNPAEAEKMMTVGIDADPAERGAWVALSSVLLNLDEFITRE
jgi:hypothetical protein